MALGFQNSPVNWQTFSAGQSTAGQSVAGGIQQLAQGLAQRAEERRKKEEEKKMLEVVGPMIEQVSGGKIIAKDVPKEALPMLYQEAVRVQKEQAEAPMRALDAQKQQLQIENERLRRGLMQMEARAQERAATTPSRVGQTVEIDGQKFYYQNESQLMPLKPAEKEKPVTQPVTVGGREMVVGPGNKYFYSDTGEPVEFAPTSNPVAEVQKQSLQGQIARLASEIAAQEQEVAGGDARTGFMNLQKRAKVIQEKRMQMAQLQAQLQAMERVPARGGAGGQAAGVNVAPAAGGGLNADEFFRGM